MNNEDEVRAAIDVILRLWDYRNAKLTLALEQLDKAAAEIEKLRAALKGLHDWYVEYARVNNLFNSDGTPGTFHELLEARKLLGLEQNAGKP